MLLLGGGLGSATLASTCEAPWLGQFRGEPAGARRALDVAGGYVDHDGWMVTAAEKERLTPVETPVPPEP